MGRRDLSLDIGMVGSYTIKRTKNQDYLYKIYYEKGKQKWEIIGNVRDLDPKDPKLAKARAAKLGKEASAILERYFTGAIDKNKAKTELMKLLEES